MKVPFEASFVGAALLRDSGLGVALHVYLREEFLRERMKNKEHETREEKALKEHDLVDKMRDLYAIPDHLKVSKS